MGGFGDPAPGADPLGTLSDTTPPAAASLGSNQNNPGPAASGPSSLLFGNKLESAYQNLLKTKTTQQRTLPADRSETEEEGVEIFSENASIPSDEADAW